MDYNYNVNINLEKLDNRLLKKGFSVLDYKIKKAVDDGMEDVTSQLVEFIKARLDFYGLGHTKLARTINIEYLSDGISIRMDSDYAVFVEYGTGYNGSENPHPKAGMDGWVYMSGKNSGRGVGGWFYPTTSSDPNPNKHIYNGELYGWTQGLPSSPFMYDTWKWGQFSATNIVNGHVNRAIKEWELSMK